MKNVPEKLKIGDVVLHKVDNRRMVVIGYEYEKPPTPSFHGSFGGSLVQRNKKEIAKAIKNPKLIGIKCRTKDQCNNLTSAVFLPEELISTKAKKAL